MVKKKYLAQNKEEAYDAFVLMVEESRELAPERRSIGGSICVEEVTDDSEIRVEYNVFIPPKSYPARASSWNFLDRGSEDDAVIWIITWQFEV